MSRKPLTEEINSYHTGNEAIHNAIQNGNQLHQRKQGSLLAATEDHSSFKQLDHPTLFLDSHGVFRHKKTRKSLSDIDFAMQGEELLFYASEFVKHRLMNDLNLVARLIPSHDALRAKCPVILSRNFDSQKTLVIFLASTRGSAPGIWSRSLLLRQGLRRGSMIPYLEAALQNNHAVLVMNPNCASAVVDEYATSDLGNNSGFSPPSPEEYTVFIWDFLVRNSAAQQIFIVAFGYGGSLFKHLLAERLSEVRERLQAVSLIESIHRCVEGDKESVKQFLRERCILWKASNTPLGTVIAHPDSSIGGCLSFSAGPKPAEYSNPAYIIGSVKEPTFFFFLTGSIANFMTKINTLKPTRDSACSLTYPPSHDEPRLYDKLTIKDFELLKVIGKGAFGKVMLVKKKEGLCKGQVFALKVLRKSAVLAKKQVDHTIAERRILKDVTHPFIVQLRFAFQTDEKLYIVMDYYAGGSLFFHLKKSQRFPEKRAQFYAAELLLALRHLHTYNIAYRDLKLENILMDSDGHVALTDFGLSKENVELPYGATTFCGTAEYIAPELLQSKGYGKAVDWWGFGILIYEMISGKTPFLDKNRKKMFHNILHKELVFPISFSENAKLMLAGLLVRNPSSRLGSGIYGAQCIMDHPFFAGIDWDEVRLKKLIPPYTPNVRDNADTTNIASAFTKELPGDTPQTSAPLFPSQYQIAFEGFTYVPPSHITPAA